MTTNMKHWLGLVACVATCVVSPLQAETLYVGYFQIVRPTGEREQHAIGGTEQGVSLAECTRLKDAWAKSSPRLKAAADILEKDEQHLEMSLSCEAR